MANDDLINFYGGLSPLTRPYGAIKKNYYKLTTGASTVNIFYGMPMDLDSNGQAVPTAAGSGLYSIGPVVGFADSNRASIPSALANLNNGPYLPGNTDAYVLIADDPDQEFVIQEGTGGTALTQASAGSNADWAFRSSSGSTTTGYSTMEINRPGVNTTSTQGLLFLIKPADGPYNSDATNNAPGNYCKWVVKIYRHRLGGIIGLAV